MRFQARLGLYQLRWQVVGQGFEQLSVQGKLVNVAPLPYQRRTAGLPSGTVVIRIPDFSPPTVARDFHKLVAANPTFPDITFKDGQTLTVCGVVTCSIKRFVV